MCTKQVMDKVNNRSMNNLWSLMKVSWKDTRKTFLLSTFNKFHTSFGVKWWHGSYLCKFYWLRRYSQYPLRYIMYYSLRYYKGKTQLVQLLSTKVFLGFLVKILLKYTYKEFLKIRLQNWNCKFEDIGK